MSSFIVSNSQIAYAVSGIKQHSQSMNLAKFLKMSEARVLQLLCNDILVANYESVNHRYNQEDKPLFFVFKEIEGCSKEQTVKFIRSIMYQCADIASWDKSYLHEFFKAIIAELGVDESSQEYNCTAWSID
jgi:hypothetical protein